MAMKFHFIFFFLLYILMLCTAEVHIIKDDEINKEEKQNNQVVLYISAANGPIDWTTVEFFASKKKNSWAVSSLVLEEFGPTMKLNGFQAALDTYDTVLRKTIGELQPDAIVVASKGVGIVAHLAVSGVWDGPTVLLSPIPNQSNHIEGGSWETEWQSTVKLLHEHRVGPIVIGVGSSIDEKTLITEEIENTGICGKLTNGFFFQKCPHWFHVVVKGDHSWKSNPKNAKTVAKMIELVLVHDNDEDYKKTQCKTVVEGKEEKGNVCDTT